MNVPDLLFWGGVGGVILYGLAQALKKGRFSGHETAGKGSFGSTSGNVVHEINARSQPQGSWNDRGSDGSDEIHYPGTRGEIFELRQRIAQVERAFDEFNAEITRRLNRINARRRGTAPDEPGGGDAGTIQTDAFEQNPQNPRDHKAALRLRARQKVHGRNDLGRNKQ